MDRDRPGIGVCQCQTDSSQAKQAAETAKAVNQEFPGAQPQATGSMSDKAGQQTILSVSKSVLAMQSKGCSSVSEQLTAAGATEEDVKKVSPMVAHTVRQLEAQTTLLEPGPEARRHPCEEVSTDDEFSFGENIPGFNSMDIESQEDIRRSL